jgi:ElaB/YqjD/DUF883 family membrane-anchored ribosome-binding protein
MAATHKIRRGQHNGDLSDHLHESAARLREQAATVGGDLRQMAVTAGESALGLTGPIERYVKQKPMKAVLISAAVGAVIGWMFRR